MVLISLAEPLTILWSSTIRCQVKCGEKMCSTAVGASCAAGGLVVVGYHPGRGPSGRLASQADAVASNESGRSNESGSTACKVWRVVDLLGVQIQPEPRSHPCSGFWAHSRIAVNVRAPASTAQTQPPRG